MTIDNNKSLLTEVSSWFIIIGVAIGGAVTVILYVFLSGMHTQKQCNY